MRKMQKTAQSINGTVSGGLPRMKPTVIRQPTARPPSSEPHGSGGEPLTTDTSHRKAAGLACQKAQDTLAYKIITVKVSRGKEG